MVASMLADGGLGTAGRSESRAIAQRSLWELYLLVLSAILSPFVTTIQRWWRVVRAGGTTARPRPAYAAMVVMHWWYHSEDEDEPLYSRWFQVDLNTWGYSFQPMVPGGHSLPLTRTQEDLKTQEDLFPAVLRRRLTSFSLVVEHREQARVPPTA